MVFHRCIIFSQTNEIKSLISFALWTKIFIRFKAVVKGSSNKPFSSEFISMFSRKFDFTIHFDFIFINVKIRKNLITRIQSPSSTILNSRLCNFFLCGLWDWKRGFLGTREYVYILWVFSFLAMSPCPSFQKI